MRSDATYNRAAEQKPRHLAVFEWNTGKWKSVFATNHGENQENDYELPVRAPAVLKSQGEKTGPVRDPPLPGCAQNRALPGAHHAGKPVEKTPVVGWLHVVAPQARLLYCRFRWV